ncbi:PepSY domain-containing protein [Prescottella agglutinans]|uniref:PepSY domain-containing protein n=1 Tax=Prescottella agglutinans TaxID=1644129 RepID=UPI003D99C488
MDAGELTRIAVAVLAPAAVGVGTMLGGSGVADAEETAPSPGILSIELDEEEGRPTAEVDLVDLQGNEREIEIDLQTGRIIEDEPDTD